MTIRELPVSITSPPLNGPRRMSYEEYLQWAPENALTEWVNGEVIEFMPPKTIHQSLSMFLSGLLHDFAKFFRLGAVIAGPYEMKLGPGGSSREPDILFVSREHADRVTPAKLLGPADLVVEIISEDSVRRDRADKFEEYEEAGVREYWILDPRPNRRRADFYQLDEEGRYQPVPVGKDGVYRSVVLPGFWLKLEWLWAVDFPDPLTTLAEIAGFPPDVIAKLEHLRPNG